MTQEITLVNPELPSNSVPINLWTLKECRKWRHSGLRQVIDSIFTSFRLKPRVCRNEIVYSSMELAEHLSVRHQDVIKSIHRVLGSFTPEEVSSREIEAYVPYVESGTSEMYDRPAYISDLMDKLLPEPFAFRSYGLDTRERKLKMLWVNKTVVCEVAMATLHVRDVEQFKVFKAKVDELNATEKNVMKEHIHVQERHIALKEGETSAFCHVPVYFYNDTTGVKEIHYKWVPRRYGRPEAMDVIGAHYIVRHALTTLRAAEGRINTFFPGMKEEEFALEMFPDPLQPENADFYREYFTRIQQKLEATFPDLQDRVYRFSQVKKKNKEGYRIRKFSDANGNTISDDRKPVKVKKVALPKPPTKMQLAIDAMKEDLRTEIEAKLRAEILEELGL